MLDNHPDGPRTRLTGARSLRLALAGLLGLVLLAGAPSPASAATVPGPSIVRTSTNGYGKFEVRWSRVTGATLYRVHVAKDPGMTNIVHRSSYTSGKSRWIDGPTILEGHTYYYRVRAYNTKARPGGYSKVVKVTTLVKPVKKPEDIAVTSLSPTSIKVTWDAASLASGYTVKISETKYGPTLWSKRVTKASTSLTATGLDARDLGRSFFVKVTADRKMTTFRDSETVAAALPFPEPSGSSFSVRVASYNAMKYTLKDGLGRTWNQRVDNVGAMIDDMDLVGVQEATWGVVNGARPIEQLARDAGLTLAKKPGTSTGCSVNSVHILYDNGKFDLQRCGNELIRESDSRYATWAVLRHTATKKDVFVLSTHLTAGSTTTADAARENSAKKIATIIARENPYDLPVILTGDLNSFPGRADDTPLSVFSDAGLVGSDLVADTRSNFKYASAHGFAKTPTNGYRVDHILTSNDVVQTKFTVRLHRESSAPSDHHPVIALLDVH